MRTEDGSIIYRCLNGKPGAFGLLVDKYKEGVYAYVYTELGNFHDAQDVTQEVFLQAYRDLRSLRRWESFAFWLHRIAYRRCMDFLRIKARRADGEFIEDQDPKVVDAPSLESYGRDQLNESLQDALDSLPEIHREVLMLHYFGGMNIKDIANAVGASPNAIRKRLSRARAQLKEEMMAMMDTAFEEQRLPAGFTLRIVEAVKRIKIQPMSRIGGIPVGLSAAVGIIIVVLSLTSHLSISRYMPAPAAPLPAERKVLKTGEIPVDVVNISQKPVLGNMQKGRSDGESEPPDSQNVILMAPKGEGGTWSRKANMPTARWGLSTVAVDGVIYAIGGEFFNGASVVQATVEAYDPVANKWLKKARMPIARVELATGGVNGKIYAISGVSDNWPESVDAVEEYDPAMDTWTEKAPIPTPRDALAADVVDGIIYVMGGHDRNFNPYSAVEAYNPATDTWERKADMPTARSWLTATAVDGIIYAIGGSTNEGGDTWGTITPLVEAYDPVADKWTRKADMPVKRGSHCASAVDGIIYVSGGGTGAPNASTNEVWAYDPVADSWMEMANMPTPRHTLASCALDGKIYVIGGFNRGASGAMEEYTPEERQSGAISLRGKLPTKWGEVKFD